MNLLDDLDSIPVLPSNNTTSQLNFSTSPPQSAQHSNGIYLFIYLLLSSNFLLFLFFISLNFLFYFFLFLKNFFKSINYLAQAKTDMFGGSDIFAPANNDFSGFYFFQFY